MSHNYEPVGKKRYKALESDKRFFIDTAKDCCRYTIPALLSYFEDNSRVYDIEYPYQCLGANGISNLASKLLTALTPSSLPFFKFMISDYGLIQERSQEIADFRIIVDKMLSDYALQVTDLIKTSNDTSFLYEMWQLLLVSGNVLIKDPDDNSNIRIYSLRDYCVRRDRAGTPVEIVLKENVSPDVLPKEILEQIKAKLDMPSEVQELPSDERKEQKGYNIYTYCKREQEYWYIHQEVKGIIISGTEQKVPLDACPFIALRIFNGSGEDYSRSYVSNYLGDLKSLDGLSQASIEAAAMISRHILLVDPTGLTDKDDVAEAVNGETIDGRPADVSFLQAQKGYDLRTVSEEASKIEERLNRAFLVTNGMIRDAERVTREEIRAVAKEIEEALGGLYSTCSHSFQVPYLKRKLYKLRKMKLLPPLDKNIKPVIVAGFEALGTNSEKDNLIEFMNYAKDLTGGNFSSVFKTNNLIKKVAAIMSINLDGLIYTDEELEQQKAQAMQHQTQQQGMDMLKAAIPQAVNNAGELMQMAQIPQGE
ncbi:portal protein [Mucispirillum schaedleri]|uniref:portal protein n=1 Tax=Mucispirillum schaedleri TaxID=248039 RepID=UPI001F563336|nr:portal protein [Mucispirillum schaedleri]